MPSLLKLREWYGYTTGSCRIPLFDSSRLHGLEVSAKDYHTEHEYYIDVFIRHRWYHGNRNRDEVSLVQAWNYFIGNVEMLAARLGWTNLLQLAIGLPTGARFKLHRLSREAGLPCL